MWPKPDNSPTSADRNLDQDVNVALPEVTGSNVNCGAQLLACASGVGTKLSVAGRPDGESWR